MRGLIVGPAEGSQNHPTHFGVDLVPMVVWITTLGCGSSAPTAPGSDLSGTSSMRVPSFPHVFMIVMENREYDEIIGSAAAPYINGLTQRYGLATQFSAETHPSLPNYMALSGGERAFADNCERGTIAATSVVDQVEAPLTPFDQDLNSGSLPNYVWITPNNCHNMHDCGVSIGDAWLSQFLPRVIGSSAFADSAVFLTWDEGSSNLNGGGRIATLVISPMAIPGFRSARQQDHYGLLRTVEEGWGLAALGNAKSATVMSEYWR